MTTDPASTAASLSDTDRVPTSPHVATQALSNRIDHAVARLILSACNWYRSVLLAFTVLVLLAIWSATSLRVDTDSRGMIDTTLPFQTREAALNETFPLLDDTIAIVVRSTNADAADAALEALGRDLADDPTVADVFAPSIDPLFRAHGLLYLSREELSEYVGTLRQTAPLLATLVADGSIETLFSALDAFEAQGAGAALDPIYRDVANVLRRSLDGVPAALDWSQIGADQADQVLRVLELQPVPDYSNLQPVEQTMGAISAAIAELDPGLARLVEIGVTGDPALRHEELDSVSRGIGLSLGGSFIVVALLLLLAFGSVARAGATLLALVVSLILATGFAAQAFAALNLVSVAFVVLLVGLGLDFTIHALLHVDVQDGARDRAHQIAEMGRDIGGALVLGAATTALAFLAFVPTDFVGIAQLGVLGAAGVAIALIVSLTFVPALVMAWPRLGRGRPIRPAPALRMTGRGRSGLLVATLALLFPAALLVGQSVRFDADPTVLRDPQAPSMQALAWLHDDPETEPYRVSVLARSRDRAAEIAGTLADLPEVASARILDDFLPEEQPAKLVILESARRALSDIATGRGLPLARMPPVEAEAFARRLAASERPAAQDLRLAALAWAEADAERQSAAEAAVFRFLPRLAETAGLQASAGAANLSDIPGAITTRFRSEAFWRVEVIPADDPRDQATLSTFVEAVETRLDGLDDAVLAGPPIHILRAGQTVAQSIGQAILVAGAATLILCFAILRDWRLVVAIAIPLATAAAFTAAASAGLGIAFNYANVIVLPLIIGLGVDSGIHLALRRRAMLHSRARYATNTPRAVIFSGLTTIAAFGSLTLSSHQGTASMGLMLAVAVTLTLAATLIWTPALCDLLERRCHPPNA